MRPPPFLEFLTPPLPAADGPQREKGHDGRHYPYTNKIWCGSVHALLRYRSKTTKMQKFPIDSYSNENFIYPFFRPRGPLTLKRGEDTSGTRVCPHAKFGVNRPAGCGEIVDKKQTKKHTVKQIPCPSLYQRVAGKNGFGILNFDRSTTRPQRSDRDRRGTVCSLLKVNQTTYGDITVLRTQNNFAIFTS